MPYLKKYAYAPLILLLHGVAVSASSDMLDSTNKKEYLLSPEVKSTLSWEQRESQVNKTPYILCRNPGDPGCSNMWQKEKEKENEERIQQHQQKKFYNSLKHK